MCNHKTRRLLKSNRNVSRFLKKDLHKKLTQMLHITIIVYLIYCF
jgi:hypothetical protein